ncbi:uncharacterized protein N7446_004215 [Penicillium canescens]|uniref:Cytochrome P450 n=1 Tax=Penicillium canescens TaxID=5083 RepID=A0AAD6I2Q4_PENCN|nr:uncharacterized protein N7446_004215 [Penicillium canescens]KAJ6027184.1 hypothetical protein N7460_012001 [Penicillium canescens]KAJ6067178.1 hypothetical protein N7446_004215 [Penicillium canescens]
MELLHIVSCGAMGVVGIHSLLFFYHLFLSPLRHFPGPKRDALSQLVWVYYLVQGNSCKYIARLHEKYGEVVRTASNEISFTTATAWQEIYGNKAKWQDIYEKNEALYVFGPQPVLNIFFCASREHARIRKHIAPAFSGKALSQQEVLIRESIHQLIQALRTRSGNTSFPDENGVVNMSAWTTFQVTDVLTSMAFGKSWGTLESGEYPQFIVDLYGTLKDSAKIRAAHRLKPYHHVIERLVSNDLGRAFMEYFESAQKALDTRLVVNDTQRKDFVTYVTDGLTREELFENLNMLVVAGLDSTATILNAAIYYITHDLSSYQKLAEEIRSAFRTEKDITITGVSGLRYLKATWVSVTQYAAYRSPRYFSNPHEFIPDRWMDESKYAGDNHFVFHPFSIGTRSCIGKTFAYANMRLALAFLIWNFDLKFQPGNDDPDSLKEYGLWEHRPMYVQVQERQ